MPDRDGKGPRKRSPRPSERKGGLKRGNCDTTENIETGSKISKKI